MGDAEDVSATPLRQTACVMKLSLVTFAGYVWHFVCYGKYYITSVRETINQCGGIQNHDSKVQRAKMGPIWGRQDPGGPHIGPMDFAIWVDKIMYYISIQFKAHTAYTHQSCHEYNTL